MFSELLNVIPAEWKSVCDLYTIKAQRHLVNNA